ncbi:Zinc finger MYM-type protein 1 [Araneus ventricosus]|uniref:Zinc finger MYM-type protein 1 n=1 Tax=Araneus ventricosus TaxID=182803 RepID=A0A4Y2B7Z6_ARAVE|nr:Zinc finger MYM-type protein 1 [Araneus ventricosus]
MLIKENRHYLVTLCEILLTISQQKIGVRESGSLFRASAIDIESESIDYGPHSGNFLSLLALVGNHDEVIARRIRHGPGNAKYTHHSVQNVLLDIMADEVKNKIFEEMQAAEYFAILADETKDLSKKEQLSIAVRYLYDGNIHEEFLCIEELETLDAEGLSSKITNVMKDRVNFQNCIGQAYDGASVVSGKHAGVNAIIKDRVTPLANYIHCFNHRLNLVLVDIATSIQCVRDCLSLLQNLYVFVSCSNIHTKWIKMQTDRGLIVMELKQMSNTRWACQVSMLRTVCKRFMLLYELLSDVIENDSNSDRVIEARVLLYQFSPDFIKTLFALRHIFEFTKNTSDLLQSPELNYSDALDLLEVLQERLNDCRTDTTMQNLWSQAANVCRDLGMHDLEESCNMQKETERRPQRAKQFPSYLKNFIVDCPVQREKLQNRGDFRREMFSVIDRLKKEIERRFFNDNKIIMLGIKALVPESTTFLKTEDIFAFGRLYHSKSQDLKIELENMRRVFARKPDASKPKTLLQLQQYISRVADAFYEMNRLIKIACTLPVSTCACERSFSTLRIVKYYMRTTMVQNRLQSLMILGVHSSRSRKLDLHNIVEKFDTLYPKSRIQLH